MCGIVGYIGPRQAAGLLIEGLRRLEYRGYDSSGIAVVNGNGLKVMKAAGKLSVLEQALEDEMPTGTLGHRAYPLGHPRRAHRRPTRTPTPTSPAGSRSIHNGIIENYDAIRKALEARGHTFTSETDTEVLAHLVGDFYRGQPRRGGRATALRDVDGAYGIAVICADEPDTLVAARKGSPLIVGRGRGRVLRRVRRLGASSSTPASVVYLDDSEMAVLTPRRLPGARPRDRRASSKPVEPDRLGPRR